MSSLRTAGATMDVRSRGSLRNKQLVSRVQKERYGLYRLSRVRKGYRGAAQLSAVLTIEFEVLLRLPANQRVRQDSCLRCRISAPPGMTTSLAVGHRLREAVYRYVAQLYITHPLYAYAFPYEQPHRACHTLRTQKEQFRQARFPLLPTFPSPTSHRRAPATPIHHNGLAQHLHQRAQHHPQLPERRQHSAAVWCPGTVADIRTMGCLRCDCPTCQRVPARRRERERLEGPEHRRYVELTPGHSMAA